MLETVFMPAVDRAGFEPIPPIMSGSDVIHAEIIKHLETSDLVLCDMSTLNANVFFELGVRTAVNKPVCLVKDTLTNPVPFDTGIMVHHEYQPQLKAWDIKAEIEALTEHLVNADKGSNGQNTLWRNFSMRSVAQSAPPESKEIEDSQYLLSIENKFNVLLNELNRRNQIEPTPQPHFPNIDRSEKYGDIARRANEITRLFHAKYPNSTLASTFDGDTLMVDGGQFLQKGMSEYLFDLSKRFSVPITIV